MRFSHYLRLMVFFVPLLLLSNGATASSDFSSTLQQLNSMQGLGNEPILSETTLKGQIVSVPTEYISGGQYSDSFLIKPPFAVTVKTFTPDGKSGVFERQLSVDALTPPAGVDKSYPIEVYFMSGILTESELNGFIADPRFSSSERAEWKKVKDIRSNFFRCSDKKIVDGRTVFGMCIINAKAFYTHKGSRGKYLHGGFFEPNKRVLNVGTVYPVRTPSGPSRTVTVKSAGNRYTVELKPSPIPSPRPMAVFQEIPSSSPFEISGQTGDSVATKLNNYLELFSASSDPMKITFKAAGFSLMNKEKGGSGPKNCEESYCEDLYLKTPFSMTLSQGGSSFSIRVKDVAFPEQNDIRYPLLVTAFHYKKTGAFFCTRGKTNPVCVVEIGGGRGGFLMFSSTRRKPVALNSLVTVQDLESETKQVGTIEIREVEGKLQTALNIGDTQEIKAA